MHTEPRGIILGVSNEPAAGTLQRALQSGGVSAAPIYAMVRAAVQARHCGGGVLLDVGCGTGELWRVLGELFDRYVAIDVVRYPGFPATGEFVRADLDRAHLPFSDGLADVVAAVETIEHLENPWRFVRELARVAKPGAWVMVTTPNQESALSLLTLLLKRRFNAFQDVHYPTHRTALLEVDLRRLMQEARLESVSVTYSGSGRVVCSARHYPRRLAQLSPRLLSDNVLVCGRKRRDA